MIRGKSSQLLAISGKYISFRILIKLVVCSLSWIVSFTWRILMKRQHCLNTYSVYVKESGGNREISEYNWKIFKNHLACCFQFSELWLKLGFRFKSGYLCTHRWWFGLIWVPGHSSVNIYENNIKTYIWNKYLSKNGFKITEKASWLERSKFALLFKQIFFYP